jgi:branched-chain amino acid transport system permease protein
LKAILRHGPTLCVALFLLALPLGLKSGSLATELVIYAMAACACNLLLGYTGLMSFGQGIFFGVGSYAAGLLLLHLDTSLALTLAGCVAMGAVVAALVGWFSIRQRGIYFVMLTLAFAQMFYFIAYSMKDITGGDNGLLGIPRPGVTLFGREILDLSSPWSYYAAAACLFLLVFALLQQLTVSRFGRTLLAIRDNEARAAAVGYDVKAFKLVAFVVSGAVTGLAGGLHAMLAGISPLSNIEYHVSEMILLMTVVGGTGSLVASVIGAAVYVVTADWLASIWPRWLMLFGFLLIAVALYMQQGLWGVFLKIAARLRGRGEVDPQALDGAPGERA